MIVVKGVKRTGKSSLTMIGLNTSGLPHAILDARKFGYLALTLLRHDCGLAF